LNPPPDIAHLMLLEVERTLTHDPTNIEAMCCSLALSLGHGLAAATQLAEHYISLVPREPFLHHRYACFLGFSTNAQQLQVGLRSIARAFELAAPNIPFEWYYDKGTLLRLNNARTDAIDAYQYYIDHMERCARKIPESYYCIASLLLEPFLQESAPAPPRNQLIQVWRYFQLGQRAEQYRLPIIAPVGQFPPKLVVAMYCCSHPMPSSVQTCSNCFDELVAAKRCSRCKVARYCSRDCQIKHWPDHKLVCRAAK
jgi:hypothetical protein